MPNTRALDGYFERVGWGGDTSPTLATLAGIQRAHMLAIPFENLDVLLGRPVRLDPDGVQAKLVGARRGGYCFEHMTLFAHVIEQLGFGPIRHSARVVLFSPRTQSTRTHMFLTVSLPEGRFVVDPGFGGFASRAPVPLIDAGPEGPGGAAHWMMRDGDYWVLRRLTDNGPADAWVSTLEHDYATDFEMANHFTATHPDSFFISNLMLNIFKPDGRISVMNRDVTITDANSTRSAQLADRAALRALLDEHFGIDLREIGRLRVPAIPEWN
jgi:N-hydroxyarylamine O-acetyltransferase